MSNPNGPVRRRRIAGEAPAVEPVAKKVAKKPAAKKQPAKKDTAKQAPPKKAPAKKAPAQKAPAAKKAAPAVPVAKTATKPLPKVQPRGTETGPAKNESRRGTSLPPRAELTRLLPLAAIALAAVIFGAVFGLKGIQDYRAGQGIDSSQSQASSAASKAAERIFTYQYDKLPEHLKQSKALMTPAFQKEFDSIAPALTDLAPQRKIVVLAQARTAAPVQCGSDCSADKASVLVFLDQARLVGDEKTPTVFGNRVVVDMVKTDGDWLVTDIKAL